MTPPELLASLRQRGFLLSVEWGQLLVSPRSRLTPDDIAAIKASRDALVGLVEPGLAATSLGIPRDPWDEVTDAMVERCWVDEPTWGVDVPEGTTVLRLEGCPVVAVGPAEVKALDAIGEWNARVKARQSKPVAKKSTSGRGGPGLGLPGDGEGA
jgi:hypothetical protein